MPSVGGSGFEFSHRAARSLVRPSIRAPATKRLPARPVRSALRFEIAVEVRPDITGRRRLPPTLGSYSVSICSDTCRAPRGSFRSSPGVLNTNLAGENAIGQAALEREHSFASTRLQDARELRGFASRTRLAAAWFMRSTSTAGMRPLPRARGKKTLGNDGTKRVCELGADL